MRELENLIYRSAVIAQGDTILIKDLPQEVVAASSAEVLPSHSTPPFSPAASDLSEEADAQMEGQLLGQPKGDPFDAAYKKLREEQSTNILERAERELIARSLSESDGKQVKAAEILGITRATQRKRIDQYDQKI